jgi:hypothetical protein
VSGHFPTPCSLGAASFETDAWDEAGLFQQAKSSRLGSVNDDRIVRFSIEQERNNTVAACIGIDKGASMAVNAHWCCVAKVSVVVTRDLHVLSLRRGCDMSLRIKRKARH